MEDAANFIQQEALQYTRARLGEEDPFDITMGAYFIVEHFSQAVDKALKLVSTHAQTTEICGVLGELDPLIDDSVMMSVKWSMSGAESVLKIYPGRRMGLSVCWWVARRRQRRVCETSPRS